MTFGLLITYSTYRPVDNPGTVLCLDFYRLYFLAVPPIAYITLHLNSFLTIEQIHTWFVDKMLKFYFKQNQG